MTADSGTQREVVGELVPMGDVPAQNAGDAGERWKLELAAVRQWLAELKGHTRRAYAAGIGWPYDLDTGEFRPEAATSRNGQTWLAWCARNGVHLFDAGREHVAAWAEALRESRHPETGAKLGQSTIAHTFTVMSSFYQWAMQAGYTTVNPAALVSRRNLGVDLKKGQSPTRSLTDDEAGTLLAQADAEATTVTGKRNAALLWLLLALGIRLAEALDLRLDQIIWTGGHRVLKLTLKGGRTHYVPIPPEVWRRFEEYLEARGVGTDLALLGEEGASAFLFATASGRRINDRDARRWIAQLAARAGLEDPNSVVPHSMRHTNITELRRQGVDDGKIQAHIGHLHAETTARYGHHVLDFASSPAFVAAASFAKAAARHQHT